MNLDERLEHVAVVGAAGKMGSGISLLLARELAWRAIERPDRLFVLNLIDISHQSLQGLLDYLKEQLVKEGEKAINRLRTAFRDRADLVENGEMIEAFAWAGLRQVRAGTTLALAKDAHLVFEAALEREDLKTNLFRELAGVCGPHTFFLSNTSSIPLGGLAQAAGIPGRLIGCHFYNPPAVQRLIEVITPADCDPELVAQTHDLAARLGKLVVPANDIAGFIGNGHFMRDGLHGLREAERLAAEHGLPKAIALMDAVSREWLVRPMGIFQLIDYVGIDVFQLILRVMESYLHDGLHSDLIDRMIGLGVKGGQTSLGGQKDGFLKYEGGRPVAVYDAETQAYVAIDPAWFDVLGPRPAPAPSWGAVQRDLDKDGTLRAYFSAVKDSTAAGAELARRYAAASRAASLRLVEQGVAAEAEHVNQVLTLGFFHAYGPVNEYL